MLSYMDEILQIIVTFTASAIVSFAVSWYNFQREIKKWGK